MEANFQINSFDDLIKKRWALALSKIYLSQMEMDWR